jgi:hypothetical protein
MSPGIVPWLIALVAGIAVDVYLTKGLKWPGWLGTLLGIGVFIAFGLLLAGSIGLATNT